MLPNQFVWKLSTPFQWQFWIREMMIKWSTNEFRDTHFSDKPKNWFGIWKVQLSPTSSQSLLVSKIPPKNPIVKYCQLQFYQHPPVSEAFLSLKSRAPRRLSSWHTLSQCQCCARQQHWRYSPHSFVWKIGSTQNPLVDRMDIWGVLKSMGIPKSPWLLTYTKSWSSMTTGWFGGTPMT